MAFQTSFILLLFLFPLFFLARNVESRLTKETFASAFGSEDGTNWAVLVAGSNGYDNYRHQADICHAYQILKRGGLKDDNIIVFMYDDIAFNEENPQQGVIINSPQGEDVYNGVPKDYTGENLTAGNLVAAILGNEGDITGGSGKVVNSGPNDHIFIYYADHGAAGLLAMPQDNDDIVAGDFIKVLEEKYNSSSYKSMVIYVEACESGSIFDGLLPSEWNIYVTTAANPSQNSYATYCPDTSDPPPQEYGTCLGDLYSVSWMEDCDAHDLQSETLEQQYQVVKERTADASEVMEYGNTDISQSPLSLYMGGNSQGQMERSVSQNTRPLSTVEQHDANILYLQEKVRRAPEGSTKREKAQKQLDEALAYRKHVDSTIQAIGEVVLGAQGYEALKVVRSKGQPLVNDWDCFKTLVGTYKKYCGALSTYGKKHMRVFANMCNAGVQPHQLAQASSQVCGNKF